MEKFKKLWMLFFVQLKYEIVIRFRYLNSTLSELALFAGSLLIILFVSDTSSLGHYYGSSEGVLITLIGYLFWSFGISALGSCSNKVEVDEQSGILESEVQSVFPLWLIYFIQTLAENLMVFGYMLILSLITCFFSKFSFSELGYAFILTFAFSLISNFGMFGIGMIFASGSIRFKRMGQWATIFQALLLMFSNVYQPIYTDFQELIPYVGGVELVRQLFLGRGFSMAKFLLYVAVNVIWFLIGIFIFSYCIKKERRIGSFDAF